MAFDKIIDSVALDTDLLAVANAIRAKSGTSDELMFPDGFVSAIETISTGGGGNNNEIIASILDKSITSINFDELGITVIGDYTFYNCTKLANIVSNNVIQVSGYAFNGCSTLASVNFPSATKVFGRAFLNCTSLLSANVPNASFTSAHASVFQGCSSLKTISNVSGQLANSFFNGCTSLEFANLTKVTKFVGTQIFLNCSALKTVVLPNTTLVALSNVNCFNGTPFASGGTGGTVYIPSALISQYQNATNWSTLYAAGTCNFVSIEGSEYE